MIFVISTKFHENHEKLMIQRAGQVFIKFMIGMISDIFHKLYAKFMKQRAGQIFINFMISKDIFMILIVFSCLGHELASVAMNLWSQP